jgi:hypothetical protein
VLGSTAAADGVPRISVHARLVPPVVRSGHLVVASDKSLDHALVLPHDASDVSASIHSSEAPLPVVAAVSSLAPEEAAPSVSPIPRADVHVWPGITASSPSQINTSEVPHSASHDAMDTTYIFTCVLDYLSCIH